MDRDGMEMFVKIGPNRIPLEQYQKEAHAGNMVIISVILAVIVALSFILAWRLI